MEFIDLRSQALRIEERLLARIKQLLAQSNYIMGKEVKDLEEALADYVGVTHSLAVSSGTDALLIALMALDIGPGDEIITTPFSFFATAEVIALLGAKPVFVDIEAKTYNINPHLIEAVISKKTKAIIAVNLYGQCADYDQINQIAGKYGLPVIEDAAQSFGALYKGKSSCSLSTIACTSFFPSKPLGAYGDGGACFTNDDDLAKKMDQIRLHGQSKRYYHERIGINGRLDTIQAMVLLEKLNIFSDEIEKRQVVAARYEKLLAGFIHTPHIEVHNRSVFAQYTLEVAGREKVQQALQDLGIPTAVHYPLGLHQQPIIQQLYPSEQRFPIAEKAADQVLSIPMHPYLSFEQQQLIAGALEEIFSSELCEA